QTEGTGRIPRLPHSPKRQRGDGWASKTVPALTLGVMWKSPQCAVKTIVERRGFDANRGCLLTGLGELRCDVGQPRLGQDWLPHGRQRNRRGAQTGTRQLPGLRLVLA